ncbi:MAG: class I SAM-dependent methyltransferase [Leptospiraceae bacterium]|nr:class I SAM-dependent methyltransferase [Leptospiraceae bacterium]
MSQDPGHSNLHDPQYVAGLFDRMASTYGILNYITSFGFSERWRKQCVDSLLEAGAGISGPDQNGSAPWSEEAVAYDLMSGMGETWPSLCRFPLKRIVAVDLSAGMCARARKAAAKYSSDIRILCQDVFSGVLPENSADIVICSFGLKTLDPSQRRELAGLIYRVLKPGGRFAFVEISDPRSWWLRNLYIFYLKRVIPALGKLFGGDATAYGMLGVYTESFGDCRTFGSYLEAAGLSVSYLRFFSGCATGVSGSKPPS